MQWRVGASISALAVSATAARRCLCCDRRDYLRQDARNVRKTDAMLCPKHAHGDITETWVFLKTLLHIVSLAKWCVVVETER